MKFKINADTLATFGQIMGWLAENGTEDQYDTASHHGILVVTFTDEQLAVQCKLVWSQYMEIV